MKFYFINTSNLTRKQRSIECMIRDMELLLKNYCATIFIYFLKNYIFHKYENYINDKHHQLALLKTAFLLNFYFI
jgi:hypothetical protein